MCGNPFLDFESLQKHARYEGGYSPGERCLERLACWLMAAGAAVRLNWNACCFASACSLAHPSRSPSRIPPHAAEHRVVQWLWQVVSELTQEERKLFLKFFTGSDRSPIGGLGNLRCIIQVRPGGRAVATSRGLGLHVAAAPCWPGLVLLHATLPLACTSSLLPSSPFGMLPPPPHAQRDGPDSNRLPTSHTCFNSLLLPSYRSKEKLADRLRLAILNSEGFGLE